MKVKVFETADALALLVHEPQRIEWHDRQALAARFAAHGNAYTIFDGNGRPIFCGGAVEMHPGHAQLWAVFGCDKRGNMVRVLRATREFIAGLPHRRVDTPVLDRPEAIRWAELLGLTCEARHRAAAHDGGDVLIYSRVLA